LVPTFVIKFSLGDQWGRSFKRFTGETMPKKYDAEMGN